MGTFRPGKPWLQLLLAAPRSQTSGFHDLSWDDSQGDGDWGGLSLPASNIPIEVPGLYWFGLNVAREAVASGSNVVGRLSFDGQVVARSRGPADATAYGLSLSCMAMVLTAGTVLKAEVQLHASASANFDEDATLMNLVRIGPVRWT